MDSVDRLFNRRRSVHEILGGGLDVILWRRKNLTRGILLVALAVRVVFERSRYSLVSLVSSVLLLLITCSSFGQDLLPSLTDLPRLYQRCRDEQR